MRRAISIVLALALASGGAAFLFYVSENPLEVWQGRAMAGGGFMAAVGAVWFVVDATGVEG